MTTNKNFPQRNRDAQDGTERHAFNKLQYMDKSGALVTVKGTGTQDDNAILLNAGYGFNLEDDSDTEVFLLANGSDMAQKFAIMSLPRNKQRKWGKGRGGIQNPLDPDKAVELNEKRVHSTDPNFAVGPGGAFEVIDGVAYFRVPVKFGGNVEVVGSVTAGGNVSTAARFIGPDPSGSGAEPSPVPGFES